ncbi:aminoglycoside 6-adenylyltransferase [Bacillus salitolerans]|uniref:Aminoglycoside 6-adenylyltransferase n=1 Tax=Bacillus salitolerans TaxID=1437434 RepID=A0ABW4LQP5_9BACI
MYTKSDNGIRAVLLNGSGDNPTIKQDRYQDYHIVDSDKYFLLIIYNQLNVRRKEQQ